MNTRADKTIETTTRAVANSLTKQPINGEIAMQAEDNRPETTSQRIMQESADASSQVRQLKSYQAMADSRSQLAQFTQGAVPINADAGLEKEADTMGMRIMAPPVQAPRKLQVAPSHGDPVAQRVLIVGSHNEKYDIEDMGLWWTMACEHMNAAREGLQPVILTLKDFERDYDQEFTMSVTDKIRFITHGNQGGETVANETPKGEGEGEWADAKMDLKTENWSDIEKKILTQIEVFNLRERERVDTGSLLKPYFCFMKENEGLMKRYQDDLGEIGVGPVFLTNKFVLALDYAKMESNASVLAHAIASDKELSELFSTGAGWKSFDELKGKLPLLNRYKTEKAHSTVNMAEMYQEIFNFIEPRYQKLVQVVEAFIAGNTSRKAPWENLRESVSSTMEGDKKVEGGVKE